MKMKKIRKTIVMGLVFAALTASLAGCGSKGDKNADDSEKIKDLVYSDSELNLGDQIEGDINNFFVQGDTIYAYCTKYDNPDSVEEDGDLSEEDTNTTAAEGARDVDTTAEETVEDTTNTTEETADDAAAATEETGEDTADNTQEDVNNSSDAVDTNENASTEEDDGKYDGEEAEYSVSMKEYIYSFKADGSDVKKLYENDMENSNEWMSGMCLSPDNKFYMIYSSYDMQKDMNQYLLRVMDESGKQVNEINLNETMNLTEDAYINSVLLDGDGNIYLSADQKVMVLDPNGKTLFEVKTDDYLMGMVTGADGKVIVAFGSYSEDKPTVKVKAIDVSKKDFGQEYKTNMQLYGNNTLIAGADDEFYYNNGNRIVAFDAAKNQEKEILDWTASNINTNYIGNIVALKSGQFIAQYFDYSQENATNVIHVLSKIDPSEIKDKIMLTFAGTYVSDDIRSQIVKYNKSQDKYQINVKDYSNSDDPITAMNADLIAGNIPDILDMSGLSDMTYINKGMLADLYTFMDKDPDINKEDFQENLLKCMETDGKLYRISPIVGINAIIGKTKDIGDKNNFTLKTLEELEKSRGNGAKGFYMASNTVIMSDFCSANYENFIDWTTGKCNFNSDEFISLLEYANTYPNDDKINYEDAESMSKMLKEGKVILVEAYGITPEEMELYDKMFGEDVTFMGYPSNTSTGVSMSTNDSFAISAKSKNQDAAWNFLKNYLTREYAVSQTVNWMSGVPLRKDAFEDVVKRYTATEKYTDDFGNKIEPLDTGYGYDDIDVQIGPLSQQQMNEYKEVVASVDHLYVYQNEIMNIINEESGAYFSGQKSAKDVADVIQNRVSTYVNENR